MANADKVIYDAEQRIEELRKREAKLRKDIDRGVSLFWNRKGGDLCLMRQQLAQVVIDKTNAERELRDTEAEMEVIRMFYFRHGMFVSGILFYPANIHISLRVSPTPIVKWQPDASRYLTVIVKSPNLYQPYQHKTYVVCNMMVPK
jgi:hypothetical protein